MHDSPTLRQSTSWSSDGEGHVRWQHQMQVGRGERIGSDTYKKFVAAKIPMLFLFGDYIDNGPQDIMSTGFWQTVLKQCRDFAEQYVKDGGVADVIHLPKHNIHGNSHFMFQEMNNKEIADLVEEWIAEHVQK